jgi:hypothetical protein
MGDLNRDVGDACARKLDTPALRPRRLKRAHPLSICHDANV